LDFVKIYYTFDSMKERLKEHIVSCADKLNTMSDKVKLKNENITDEEVDFMLPLLIDFEKQTREVE